MINEDEYEFLLNSCTQITLFLNMYIIVVPGIGMPVASFFINNSNYINYLSTIKKIKDL